MERTQQGFIIVLTEEESIELFSTDTRISHLTSVDQNNYKPRFICNSREEPDDVTPSVNSSIDKASESKAM